MRHTSPLSPVALIALLLLTVSPLEAQLRGGGQSRTRATGVSSWWFSGGAGVIGLGPVNDGVSGSSWDFSGDPRWQLRGTLEKTTQPNTTIGVGVSYGNVDLAYQPFPDVVPQSVPDQPASVTTCQITGCSASVDLWAVQAVMRGGGASEGMYQVVEVAGGVQGFRNMRTREDDAVLPVKDAVDINASIGYGLGYALSRDFHIAFVQDFGIAWHSGDALPDGYKRTYRTRNSRVTLRYGLGSLRR